MLEIADRVVDPMTMPTCVGRWAHAVENERITPVAVRLNIKAMMRGIDALVRRSTPVQFGEKSLKPVWMLVINGHRPLECSHKKLRSFEAAQLRSRKLK